MMVYRSALGLHVGIPVEDVQHTTKNIVAAQKQTRWCEFHHPPARVILRLRLSALIQLCSAATLDVYLDYLKET